MTTGEKLAKLRKENNYTQEQLADVLDVSRQSVSKWESDAAYPETDKLIKLGKLYGCSMDYLLKDDREEDSTVKEEQNTVESPSFHGWFLERKSTKEIFGMPLWHINIGAGRTAKGFFALGFRARGVFAFGLLSMGFFSAGVLSLGLISVGAFVLGLLAAGAVSLGIISAGAISVGILAVGAIAIGDFSIGALAVGKYFALGDNAHGIVAIGKSAAKGTYTAKDLASADYTAVLILLDDKVPKLFGLFKAIVKALF